MTIKIHVNNIDPKDIPNAVQAIADFLRKWSKLSKVEIIVETRDC